MMKEGRSMHPLPSAGLRADKLNDRAAADLAPVDLNSDLSLAAALETGRSSMISKLVSYNVYGVMYRTFKLVAKDIVPKDMCADAGLLQGSGVFTLLFIK